MFAQVLANRLARGGVHLALAPPMMALLLVASLAVLLLVDTPEDIGLAGFAGLIAAVAVWLIDRMQDACELPVEAWA